MSTKRDTIKLPREIKRTLLMSMALGYNTKHQHGDIRNAFVAAEQSYITAKNKRPSTETT